MSTCRTPAAGFVRLRCHTCGETKTIAFACKSRLCPSCGWLHAQRVVESVQARLIKCQYRHLVFSVPRELRAVFFWERELLPQACHAAAAATLECFQGLCKRHELVPGIIATCHTFGRNLAFHVHVHLLVTEGALQRDGLWQPVHFFPAQEYRRRWQYHLLTKLRKACRPRTRPSGRSVGCFGAIRRASLSTSRAAIAVYAWPCSTAVATWPDRRWANAAFSPTMVGM